MRAEAGIGIMVGASLVLGVFVAPVSCPIPEYDATVSPSELSEFDVPKNLIAARHMQIAIAEARDHISVVFEDQADITCGLRSDWYQCVARLKELGGTVRLHCSATGDGCYAVDSECPR